MRDTTSSALKGAALAGALVTGGIVATQPPPCKDNQEIVNKLVDDQRHDLQRMREDLETRERVLRTLTGKPGEIDQLLRTVQDRSRDLERQLNEAHDRIRELERKPCPEKAAAGLTGTPPPTRNPSFAIGSPATPLPTETFPTTSLTMASLIDPPRPTPLFVQQPPLRQPPPMVDEPAITPLPSMTPAVALAIVGIAYLRGRGK